MSAVRKTVETGDKIFFYGHSAEREFNYMSNFYLSSFVDGDGRRFVCSEQYFMYKKCLEFDPKNVELLNAILAETDPAKIKNFGRQVKNYDEKRWDQVRYGAMRDALMLKFGQNLDIKKKLLATSPKKLYEASPYDKIWGIGFDAESAQSVSESQYGQNLLGLCLMEVRSTLKMV